MKAMKQILIVIAFLSCTTLLMATQYQLHQTSPATYRSIGSNGAGSTGIISNGVHSTSMPVNMSVGAAKPSFNFHSTSVMSTSGSNLPSAASTGCVLTNNPNGNNLPRGPRRAIDKDDVGDKPEGWQEPMDDPITDAVPCLLLLAAAYCLYLRRKNSVPTRDTRHNQ